MRISDLCGLKIQVKTPQGDRRVTFMVPAHCVISLHMLTSHITAIIFLTCDSSEAQDVPERLPPIVFFYGK